MKQLLIALGMLCCVSLGAQQDTIQVTQETGSLENQRFIDRYDVLFGTQEPARWMFKWNPLAGGNQEGLLNLSAEHKLTPAFSVQVTYGMGAHTVFDSLALIPIDTILPGETKTIAYHHVNLQARWYYDMAGRMKRGLQANNFSGNYLGLEAAHTEYGPGLQDAEEQYASARSTLALRFGVQRRLFRYGYMDVSYGLGMQRNRAGTADSPGPWGFFTNTRFALGLALVSPNRSRKEQAYCDVLQCFREENQMFKVDLYNLLRVKDNRNIKSALALAYERRIGQSYWSVEVEGRFRYEKIYEKIHFYERDDAAWEVGGHIQPRYYYYQSKEIARGKTGRNLSGIYLAWQFAGKYVDQQRRQPGALPVAFAAYRTGPLWGLQYRLFKNGFIDLNGGMVFGVDVIAENQSNPLLSGTSSAVEFIGNLRVGLAF